MRWWIANEARGTKLAIIISYPTSASGIIVLLKTRTKKTTGFQLVSKFRTIIIFREHGIIAHIPRWVRQSKL